MLHSARIPIWVGLGGLTLFFAAQAARLRPEWSEQAELSARDPHYAEFQRFRERFGGHDHLIVLVQADTVFDPAVLAHLADVSEALRDIPLATDVVSLATVPIVRGTGEAARMEPFLPDLPPTPDVAKDLAREALGHEPWIGTLVSADGRTAAINVLLPAMNDDIGHRLEAVAAVEEILAKHRRPGTVVTFTGFSPLAHDMLRAINHDLLRFSFLMPLVVLICLWRAFRTWRGIWLPTLTVAVPVVWTLGLFNLAEGSLNAATAMLPTLVAVNGLSYAIHFLNDYHLACARTGDVREVLVGSVRRMGPALGMAALTTAIGFGTLVFAEMRSLRELGWATAVGILMAYGLGMVLMPLLLSGLPRPSPAALRHRELYWLRAGLGRIAAFVNRDRWKTPAALALLAALAAIGISRITADMDMTQYLPESMPSKRSLRTLQETMAGFQMLEVVLDAQPGTFLQPDGLHQIELMAERMAGLEGVDKVATVNDFYGELHRARHPGAPGRLPETPGQIAETRLLLASAGRRHLADAFVTPDGAVARLSVRLGCEGTAEHLRLARQIEALGGHELAPDIRVSLTGVTHLFAVKIHALTRSLFRSFGLTFLMITVLFSVLLRSPKAGICAMVPNILPVVAGFGLMGAIGISLNAATVMIASVGIGIAVDDTVHLVLRYRRERVAGRSPNSSVRHALLGTGRALVYSSVGLAAGFASLGVSQFRPNREFGLLVAFVLLVALAVDLFVTPYLMRLFNLFEPPEAE